MRRWASCVSPTYGLHLWLSDLSRLLRGEQMGDEQRPHLDLPGLRAGAHDGV